MPTPTREQCIWITDAAKEYGRSREWLDKQIHDGKLSVVTFPGDRKVYLLRAELDDFLKPTVERRTKDSQAG